MLKYNLDIPLDVDVDSIMDEDFYIMDDIKGPLLHALTQPIKFGAFASIFVKEGSCAVDINLKHYNLKAPCVLNIKIDQIVQIKEVSNDLNVACLVLAHNLMESVVLALRVSGNSAIGQPVDTIRLNRNSADTLQDLYHYIKSISSNKKHPYSRQALLHAILSYFYHFTSLIEQDGIGLTTPNTGRISDMFISLVQQHFRSQRFLDFYADRLSITSKHLSRTVKQQTGFTAVEWIERYVILEAKAMLKSSTMTIQQIADHLNFPSQSFFGKYFKKSTGVSPKDYRNS